jgi:predicted DNA-binding protein (UPF0251 family)
MPRPRKIRFVPSETAARYYKPRGIPLRELTETVLPLDGLEALRLADVEGLEQVDAAQTMGISRSTFSRLLAQARTTVATALTTGQALRIEGGPVTTAELRECGCGARCRCRPAPAGDDPPRSGGGDGDE